MPSSPPQTPPSPAGTVLGKHSPLGQLPGLLFKGQGEALRQRELGAWAQGGGHSRAIVQQLGQHRLQLHSDHPLPTPLPPCSPT